MKEVLFISHDAFRAGAQILLLNLLSWLKTNSNVPFQILLKDVSGIQGDLRSQFEALAPVYVFNPPVNKGKPWQKKLVDRLGISKRIETPHLSHLKHQLQSANIGLIYANTVANHEVLEFLSDLNCPVICHVHELSFWIQNRLGLENFSQLKQYTSHYIAVSKAVQDNLINNHKIPTAQISLIYPFIKIQPDACTQTPTIQNPSQNLIFEELGMTKSAKLVCASGTLDWRKGVDLFIQLAFWVHKKLPQYPVHFVWVGGDIRSLNFAQFWHDVMKAGLVDYVHFVGVKHNPIDYFAASDVFVLTSREDPFPLVCLEAASGGKPIVCFDRAGGEPEFVENDCGFVVPYLDIEQMASKVIELLDSPALCQKFGNSAKKKVETLYDVTVIAPQIETLIKQYSHFHGN